MEEIELKSLLQMVKKRWWIVAVVTFAAIIASAFYSFFILKSVYQSDTSLYVGRKVDTQGALAYNDILLNDRLISDYRELVKSRLVADIVIKDMGLENITPDTLAAKLSVNSKKDTRIIQISTQDTDPQLAKDITTKVAEVFQQQVVDIMKVENVQIIDKAELPQSPIKPNRRMNIAIASLLGLMLGLGIVFVLEYMDDTVKTPEDVRRRFNLPVIGSIPVFPE